MELDHLSLEELRAKAVELAEQIAMLDVLQNAMKTALNSLFGAAGNPGFSHFDEDIAESITLNGQTVILYSSTKVNEKVNAMLGTSGVDYVNYIDTDSVALDLSGFVNRYMADCSRDEVADFLDGLGRMKLSTLFNEFNDELATLMSCPKKVMSLKREAISQSTIYIAKKRYIYDVVDSEGVRFKENKLKTMGVEIVRSSTPASCKIALKAMLRVIFDDGEEAVQKEIRNFRDKFMAMPLTEIAIPRSANEVRKWTTKMGPKTGTPFHVKAAIAYNMALEKNKLIGNYPPANDGAKVKIVYLKEPNPYKNDTIAFIDNPPVELNLDKWVDRTVQFEKAFMAPLTGILDAIGWSAEKKINLKNSLFGDD